MERLLYFIYRYRAFFSFLLLELFCAWLIVQNNQYQGAAFFNTSNSMVAGLNSFSQDVREYFSLRETNRLLAEENARLRNLLEKRNQALININHISDTAITARFDYISAKVVNNSVDRVTNFLTINKGSGDGVVSGMAVISPSGAVGKVKTVSQHYSVVTSLLNIDVMTSAILKRTGNFGTVQWDGRNQDEISLKYVPPHVDPHKGDTIITSGFNAVFPEGIMIGTIADIKLSPEALFYDIRVKLSQDFRRLSYVAVIKSNLKHEQDSVEQTVNGLNR